VVTLTFPAAHRYDTAYFARGEVGLPDFALRCEYAKPLPWPLFHELATRIGYDIGEQAFTHYLIALENGKPLTAIPAFPSRFFPHLAIVVNTAAGIAAPRDLEGKRVATLGFGWNTAVWARGVLAHQYGVAVERVVWVEDTDDRLLGGLDYPVPARFTVERRDGLAAQLLAGTDMEVHGGMSTVELLESGVVDALIAPAGGPQLGAHTRHLFPDPYPEIAAYVRATGAFPINTVITLRRELAERHPQLPRQLMDAFHAARARYHAEAGAQPEHMGLATSGLHAIGVLPDRYGVEANRSSIETALAYAFEQGVTRRRWRVDELFAVMD
jgi:4,5-dihydroxyphthalate decarboxylase